MKKVEEPTVRKTLTVATSRIPWQPLIGLVAAIAVMSMVVPSRAQLHHVPPAAPTYIVLHTFVGSPTDGATPYAGLTPDGAGNLYGTTLNGGASGQSGTDGFGVVFKLSPTGTETVLYSFTGGADGASPSAGLIQDAAGNLYGTTSGGGAASTCNPPSGCGVVFKLNPISGTEKVLYRFKGADGAYPLAGLVRDTAGNLYGTTNGGGAHNLGVVFKLNPTGAETVLHSFNGADGAGPYAGSLVLDAAGNLYGTTNAGGAHNQGVVFKLCPAGSETVLHSFTGGADGGGPRAGLLQDAARNLYGTTLNGGTSVNGPCAGGCGVVFKLSPCDSGYDFSVVYTFPGGAEGGNPEAGLIQDPVGNLYGTTGSLAPGYNVVFKLSPAGTETVLYTFIGGADGGTPYAGLVRDSAGNLYGTTVDGGDTSGACGQGGGCGVVFRLGP
jgi:uncharacterized repeat protein (TIGR03803 family)